MKTCGSPWQLCVGLSFCGLFFLMGCCGKKPTKWEYWQESAQAGYDIIYTIQDIETSRHQVNPVEVYLRGKSERRVCDYKVEAGTPSPQDGNIARGCSDLKVNLSPTLRQMKNMKPIG